MILLVAMNKIVTNSINELPNYRRDWFFWRYSHKFFAGMVMLCGVVHTAAHHIRQVISYGWLGSPDSAGPSYAHAGERGYEYYSTITGYMLWACLIGLTSQWIMLQFPRKFCKARRGGFPYDQVAKQFFRKWHIFLYVIYTVIYCGHCYNLWPLLFLVLYQLSYRIYKLPITGAMYSFNVKGRRSHYTTEEAYDLELWFELAIEVPAQFGLYCQVQVDNVNASYTLIPNQERANVIHFKVRQCVLTEKFRKMVGNDFKNMHYMGGTVNQADDRNYGDGTEISTFNHLEYNIQVYGPFHSSDLELANSKKLCVLTTGIGGTVAYSTIAFARGRPGHWSNLMVIHYDKHVDVEGEALRMGVVVGKDDVRCNDLDELAKFALTGHPRETKTDDDLSHGQMQKVIPTFISLEGRLHAPFTKELITTLHKAGFDFLVCSRIWTGLIEDCNEKDPFHGSVVKSLHIEEFD
jgi:hypothetical protein